MDTEIPNHNSKLFQRVKQTIHLAKSWKNEPDYPPPALIMDQIIDDIKDITQNYKQSIDTRSINIMDRLKQWEDKIGNELPHTLLLDGVAELDRLISIKNLSTNSEEYNSLEDNISVIISKLSQQEIILKDILKRLEVKNPTTPGAYPENIRGTIKIGAIIWQDMLPHMWDEQTKVVFQFRRINRTRYKGTANGYGSLSEGDSYGSGAVIVDIEDILVE